MTGQHVFIWTGGDPRSAEECHHLAEGLPVFPLPAPLRPAAAIEYSWGDMKFDIWAIACSLRTTAWGSEQMTWLHCKAMNAAEITPDQPTALMAVLIPAHYVTGIRPGPAFRLSRSRESGDLGVFPPNQPAPAGSLPLAEVERLLATLLAPERN
jgi:hypothetical protein